MSVIIDKPSLKIIAIEVPDDNVLKSINFFLVEKDKELFLIDAGYNHQRHWEYLKNNMDEHGYTLDDLTAILLTHNHGDHVGLVYKIVENHDIPVYIKPSGIPKLKKDPEFLYMSYLFSKDLYYKLNCGEFGHEEIYKKYKRQMSSPHSAINWNFKEIVDDSIFGFEIISIPGHALDQVAFYLPDEEIIFCGDLLINHIRSSAFIEPDLSGKKTNALLQHIESLEKIIALQPKIALSGHGTVITDPVDLAKRRLEAIDSKAENYLQLIESGISTGSAIAKHRHPKNYETIFLTIITDASSFIEYLEKKGDIQKEEVDGIWYYSKTN